MVGGGSDKRRKLNREPLHEDAALEISSDRSTEEGGPLCLRTSVPRAVSTMCILLREALSGAVQGLADSAYIRGLARLKLAGADVGSKYHSRQFVRSAEYLAGQAIMVLTRESLDRHLPALAIPSDMALIFDGVSIGASSFATHETLLVIGVVVTRPEDGQCCDRLLAAPSHGWSHSGVATRDLLLEVVRARPLNLASSELRPHVGVVGGDGAVARGGEHARHVSSGAADLLWDRLQPRSSLRGVDWDLFHRTDIAGNRAAKASPMAQEVRRCCSAWVLGESCSPWREEPSGGRCFRCPQNGTHVPLDRVVVFEFRDLSCGLPCTCRDSGLRELRSARRLW